MKLDQVRKFSGFPQWVGRAQNIQMVSCMLACNLTQLAILSKPHEVALHFFSTKDITDFDTWGKLKKLGRFINEDILLTNTYWG